MRIHGFVLIRKTTVCHQLSASAVNIFQHSPANQSLFNKLNKIPQDRKFPVFLVNESGSTNPDQQIRISKSWSTKRWAWRFCPPSTARIARPWMIATDLLKSEWRHLMTSQSSTPPTTCRLRSTDRNAWHFTQTTTGKTIPARWPSRSTSCSSKPSKPLFRRNLESSNRWHVKTMERRNSVTSKSQKCFFRNFPSQTRIQYFLRIFNLLYSTCNTSFKHSQHLSIYNFQAIVWCSLRIFNKLLKISIHHFCSVQVIII